MTARMTTLKVTLTASQVDHLVTLLTEAEREGSYYGNPSIYWKRHGDIKSILMTALFNASSHAAAKRLTRKK